MRLERLVFRCLTALVIIGVFVPGCTTGRNPSADPIIPFAGDLQRQAMDFHSAEPIFGDESTRGSDVDIASVVWGGSAVAGDIVVFDDDTSWDVAV